MNWLISLLGGVPASVHGDIVSKVQAIEGTLSEAENKFAFLKSVLEETQKELLCAKSQAVDVAKRLSAAVQKAAQDLDGARGEAAKDLDAARAEAAKEIAVVVSERKLASDFRRTAESEVASLRKTAAGIYQERDSYLKDLNALRLELENLKNTLVEAQSAGEHAQQQYIDAVATLEAIRAENVELVAEKTAAAEAAAAAAVVPEKPEKRRR